MERQTPPKANNPATRYGCNTYPRSTPLRNQIAVQGAAATLALCASAKHTKPHPRLPCCFALRTREGRNNESVWAIYLIMVSTHAPARGATVKLCRMVHFFASCIHFSRYVELCASSMTLFKHAILREPLEWVARASGSRGAACGLLFVYEQNLDEGNMLWRTPHAAIIRQSRVRRWDWREGSARTPVLLPTARWQPKAFGCTRATSSSTSQNYPPARFWAWRPTSLPSHTTDNVIP